MSKEVFLNTKKLSEFTTIAIDEFEKVINMDGYFPNSNIWHYYDEEENYCAVCIGGAVMAGLFDAKYDENKIPESFVKNVRHRLKYVENIRRGKFSEVAECLGVKWPLNVKFNRIEPHPHKQFNGPEFAKKLINDFRDRIIPEMIEIEKEIGV